MKAKWHERRSCWRVIVPPRFSETGKRQERFFPKREDATSFISRVNHNGSVQRVELDEAEKAVLSQIRSFDVYGPNRLLEAWQQYCERLGNVKPPISLGKLVELYYERQIREKRAVQTLQDDRWRLNRLKEALGSVNANELTTAQIHQYFEEIGPGTNRRSHYKTLRKLFKWSFDLDYLAADPMAKIKPMDKWGVNDETITVETFRRLLKVCAGVEAPHKGLEPTKKFAKLLPYFVLGGLAGMRRCEMVSRYSGDPVIEWSDILWDENLIHVRDVVAKQTKAKDRQRWIPLEPAARAILEPLKQKSGRVIAICHTAFNRAAARRRDAMKLKLPENCLRNSYATYAQTFRSSGEVAKAMGDQESTIQRFYTRKLKPETGRAWFDASL
jgi:site-specific recombinase XerD